MEIRIPLILDFNKESEFLDFIKITDSISLLYLRKHVQKKRIINAAIARDHMFWMCIGNGFRFTLETGEIIYSPQYSSFIYAGEANQLQLHLEKNKRYEIIAIGVKDLQNHLNEYFIEEYSPLLDMEEGQTLSKINLGVIDNLTKIVRTEKKPISKMELLGYVYKILHLIIDQYIYQTAKKEQRIHKLEKWEIDVLRELTAQVRKYPEKNYTLSEISKQTGITISNLQHGFKKMHETTFALFVRNMRLKKAVELLCKSNLNITQIVDRIGLKSDSYFSRIFKEKYGVTPRQYRQKS